ncbi:hypothetical protein [Paracoccus benzoatiresistens]|uniref:TolB-like protein n=1 Tax=Paracoccus benzoatiresistens TaxID=2997341 RepID=A0ABT4J8M2_9RHOB|nr:hypothetical protein [Paracoccus sp. EF6]MCZ0963484.1 hypothetical protein [Paracoccus sp. EF6]
MSDAIQCVIRDELARVLASSDFDASERNRRFLRHVVEETLAGRGERIKAYSIATLVFGRGEDFDAMKDSIVRIEAGRLRRALDNYYLKHGGADIRISIPKGSYVPTFQRQGAPAAAADPPANGARALQEYAPRILVEPLDLDGDTGVYPLIARTLTRQVIAALTRFTELFVYGLDTSEQAHRAPAPAAGAAELQIDYRLSGTVTIAKHALIAEILMRREGDGRFIWAQSFEREMEVGRDPSDIVGLCAEIAGHVARIVALRDGIVDSQARILVGSDPRHFAGYQKLLDFQDYWRTLDKDRFDPLRRDLEAAIAAEPGFAAAHACLSMLYTNAGRFGYDVGNSCAEPLERALDLAREAIRLAPSSSRAYHARALAEWFLGRRDECLQSLKAARALNPNDPELMAEMGFRLAARKDWESGVPLLEEAYARSPLLTGQYRMGLFLYHFAHGRHEQALDELRAVDALSIAHVHLAAAAALAALGRKDEAHQRLARAEQLAPGVFARLREDLAFRQFHPDLIAAIAQALASLDPEQSDPVRPNKLRRI